jgi:hypothetical protein
MPKENTQFSKTYQPPNESKRKPKQKTVLREILGVNNIEDLKADVLKVWANFIQSDNPNLQSFASKEAAKYIFPQKREHSGEINSSVKVQFINLSTTKEDKTDD